MTGLATDLGSYEDVTMGVRSDSSVCMSERCSWSLASIVEHGAKRWPNSHALVDGDGSVTFSELRQRVNVAAVRLQRLAIRAGDRVAVVGGRSSDTAIAILAIATIGAIYVALDPEQPVARLLQLITDADVSAIVAEESPARALVNTGAAQPVLFLSELVRAASNEHALAPASPSSALASDSVAYILYTSGSTGLPKGVQIEHGSILAFFESHNERVGFQPGDRCLSTGPFHFDVSVMDVFLPLHFGATVYFAPKLLVPSLICGMLSKNRITHFYAVGTLLGLITGDGTRLQKYRLDSLRILQTGAEVCNVRVVNEWLRRMPWLKFLNSYGPTEATVGCLSYLKPYDGPLLGTDCPIGKPHRGTVARVVGADGKVIDEAEVIGELVVSGRQMMRGYWRRALETKRSLLAIDGVEYYRTGDHVYVDTDGNYHFVGRVDDEVKLRGFRIHLNEVSCTVERDPRVLKAVVGIVSTDSARELVAAVILDGSRDSDTMHSVMSWVSSVLPAYMVPSRWAVVSTMPRLPSGKTDRSGLLQQVARAVAETNASCFVESENGLVPCLGV